MSDVEFLEPPNPYLPSQPGGDPQRHEDLDFGEAGDDPTADGPGFRIGVVLAAVLPLAAAAVLLGFGPVRTIVGFKVGAGASLSYSVDGWGRYRDLGNGTTFIDHATRYGIALTAIGVVYVLLTVAVLVLAVRPAGMARYLGVVSRVAIGTTGALVGVLAVGALQVDSVIDSTRTALHQQQSGEPLPSGEKLHVRLGACVWLTLAALGLAIIAVAAVRWLQSTWELADLATEELQLRLDELDDEDADDDDPALLVGEPAPHVALPATSGRWVAFDQLPPGRTIVYVYPLTARPGVDLPPDWDEIPGARGCTPEACGFRDHLTELTAAGASAVFGVSAQDSDYQREAVGRLNLPFELLADPGYQLADALGLPTFEAGGMRLYQRLTLILRDDRVEHVFAPITDPGAHAAEVLDWLRARP